MQCILAIINEEEDDDDDVCGLCKKEKRGGERQ